MTSLLSPLLDGVNGFGRGVADAVATALSVNHWVASKIVLALTWVAGLIQTCLVNLGRAVVIILEDLFVFLQENFESLVCAFEFAFDVIDRVLQSCLGAVLAVRDGFYAVGLFFYNVVMGICGLFVQGYESTRDFFSLLGQSVVLLFNLVPRTIYLAATGAVSLAGRAAEASVDFCVRFVNTLKNAPLEVFIGVMAGAAITYLAAKLGRKLVRDYHLTPLSVLKALLSTVKYLHRYLIVGGLIKFVRLLFRFLLTTLAQIHVPLFHHAGDSDEDDEDGDDADRDVISHYDSSDNEERERQEQKRRNYELLMRRKQQRRSIAPNDEDESDVEGMLLAQVEREREDKLCAICQDNEKCIMMLPCRHLCVCQGCQFLWQRHHDDHRRRQGQGGSRDPSPRKCPICRKHVKQTIKAFL